MRLPFDKIYCLLTPTNKERVDNVNKQKQIIENITVFNSIYIPNVYNIAHMLLRNNKFIWNGGGNGTALNCALNHYTMIKQTYDDGYNNVLIFEDDVCFNNEYFNVFNKLPTNWDCIRFCWTNYDKQYSYYVNNNEYFTKSNINTWGTQCYVLNRNGMKYYLDSMNNNFAVADNPLFTLPNTNLQQYYCNVNVCYNSNLKSIIQRN